MPIKVQAYGRTISFPDGTAVEDIESRLKDDEHLINPDYKEPLAKRITSSAKDFARDSLGINVDDVSRRISDSGKSIADRAEESASEGENDAAIQVSGAPVRQSTYNKALLDDSFGITKQDSLIPRKPDRGGVLGRIRSAADQDISGQVEQQNLQGAITDTPPEPEGGFVASAKNIAGQTIKGAGLIGSDYLDQEVDNPIAKYGQSIIDNNPVAVRGLEDIKDKPFLAFREAAGNSVTPMAGMVGAKAIGMGITSLAPLTGPAAPIVAAIGQVVQWLGPTAVAALPTYGSIRDKQILNDPDNEQSAKAKAIASLGAATVGVIEQAFGPQQWAVAALTKEGRSAMARKFASTTTLGAITKGAVKGAAIEGAEELVQSPVEQLASFDDPTTKKNIDETLFSGAMGAIGGSAPGGVAGGLAQYSKVASDKASKINAERTKLGLDKILNSGSVDEAINAANESVSNKPVTKKDILKVIDPTLKDLEGFSGYRDEVPQEDTSAPTVDDVQPKTDNSIQGNDTEIVLPDNTSLPAKWAVVDADNVKASIKEGINQPRDRTRAVSDLQIQGIASNPDYRRLSDSPIMDVGSPTLSHDGLIVGGNGRFEGVSRAHDLGSAVDYINKLKIDAAAKGINPDSIDGIKKPVLVRQITQPFDTRKLAIASNSGTNMQYSGLELANIDAGRMHGIEDLDITDNGDIALTGNNITKLKQSLVDYSPSEISPLVSADGSLSPDGMKRVRNAILSKAYGNSDTLSRMIDSTDTDMRNVLGALTKSAGHVAKVRSQIKSGAIPKEVDITDNLLGAVETLSQIRSQGQPLDNYLQQQGMFGDGLDADSKQILQYLHDNLKSQKKLTDFVRNVYGQIANINQSTDNIFGDNVVPSKKDLIENAKPAQQQAEQQGIFTDQKPAESGQSESKAKTDNAGSDEGKFSRSIEERIKDRDRAKQLERKLNAQGFNFTITPKDVRNFTNGDRGKEAEADTAEKIAKIFGRRVVWIDAKGDHSINGVVIASIKDTIFLDVGMDRAAHAVMGHELSHHLEHDNPAVYKELVKSLESVIKDHKEYAKKYEIDSADKSYITKEIVGDIMGDNFTNPEFWNRVAEINPNGFKRIAEAIKKWLNGLILKAKSRGLGSEQWVTDAKKARDIVAEAVAKYADTGVQSGSDKAKFSKENNETRILSYPINAGEPISAFSNTEKLKLHKDYIGAKSGNFESANILVNDLVPQSNIDEAKTRFGSDVVYVPVILKEQSGTNRIPHAMAALYASSNNSSISTDIYEKEKAFHTGMNMMERLISRASFSGKVDPNIKYVLVDDVTTSGATLADMASYIQSNGGHVVGSVLLTNAMRTGSMFPSQKTINRLEAQHGNAIKELFGIEPQSLTKEESQYLLGFRTTDELRNRANTARDSRSERILLKKISKSKDQINKENAKFSKKEVTQKDKDYLDAVNSGDLETAQNMVDVAAREKGYISGNEYRMMHQAPNREDYNLATIKENGIVPNDYWTHPHYYQSDSTERDSFYKVNSAIDRQKRAGRKAAIQVYRAVPKDVKDDNFRNGDWVTPSREYAKLEGESIPGGYRIISAIPKIDNLWWDANSINELGYDDGKEYAYKNTKNNRKLIDPVTYDDEGNIIPLSKRFNQRSDDVRFSRKPVDERLIPVSKRGKSIPETISINGVDRPTHNSEGKLIHPTEEGIKNFYKWFGGSKIVDDQGRPLVVYHGSPDLRFTNEDGVFKSPKERYGFGDDDAAHWFTTELSTAKSYADPKRAFDYQNAEEGVIETYIKIVDPLTINAQGSEWRSAQKRGSTGDAIKSAKENGNDGVIIKNVKDNYNNNASTKPSSTFTVFNPNQIKSAIGNDGSFSKDNDDIRFSFAGQRSRTLDGNSLVSAQDRLAKGDDPETVRQDTGWFIGKDGKPRYEINDSDARWIDGFSDTNGVASDFIDHQRLFSAYPALASIPVSVDFIGKNDKPGGNLIEDGTNKSISVKARDVTEAKSILLHELQHGIQTIEGFASGSDSQNYNQYRRMAGEVEARNVQNRMNMSDSTRREISPERTQDVSNDDVIVMFNGKKMDSAPLPDNVPDETRFQKIQRLYQDSFNRFRVVKEFLEKRGINLSEQADVYAAEERYHAKTANQLEDFREHERNPLMEKIAKAGFTPTDISDYLLAQHASEANEQARKLHDDPDATAYGITDDEAKAYLEKASPKLGKLANEFRDITEKTKKLLLDNGLLNKDITDAWESTYQHYVPVKGGEEDGVKQGTGKGLKTSFKPKRRLGHDKRDEAVIENILMDHERAIMAVEKNRVGKHLVMMAAQITMPELLTIDKPKKRQVLQKQTAYEVQIKGVTNGVFGTLKEAQMFKQLASANNKTVSQGDITIQKTNDQRVIMSASPMLADNEINVYIDGHAIRVQLNDDLLARAYTKMGIDGVGNIVAAGRMLNGYLSKVYTGYNPEFIVTNIVRDFSSGTINLTGERGLKMAAKTIGNYPSSFAMLMKHAATNGKSSNEWIDGYRASGGNTGAAYLSDMERLGNEVKTEYASYLGVINNLKQGDFANASRAAGRKVFNVTLKWIYNLNQAGENAMRLSAFRAMIDNGKTVNEAAKVAKNITVNFNRKGEFGAEANAAYLFFNASVQGVAATAHALTKGKHKYQANALTASMVTLGYLAAASLAGGDEDEYDKLNDYTKERNVLIKSGDGYIKIPIPYGYGFFWNLGRSMADAQRTGELGKLPWHIATSAIQEFTPFGDTVVGQDEGFHSDQVLLGLLPTAIKIPAQPIFNKQLFSGSEVMPDSPFDKSKPEREKMFRNTQGTLYDKTAGWLETAGFDVSPETLKYMTRTFTGGAGAFVDSGVSAAMLKTEGAELDTSEIPFVRKAYTELSIRDTRAAYYKARDEAKTAAEEFNRAKARNDFTKIDKIINDKQELLALDKYATKLSKVISIQRDEQDAIRLSDDYTVAEKRLRVKELEKQEESLYNQYLDVFKIDKMNMKKREE